MINQLHGYEERLIQEVWGELCIECDSRARPNISLYQLKSEQVIVLSCPKCDFTIVVVEVDKLVSHSLNDELKNNSDVLFATHSSLRM
ncbi:MAG: hypothetical protein JXA54_14305 [Candidatus Heimdallarchaeota archaeon]|nr:hypothetical protein [Candidatus Heimdallarchaeota archaeon]